MVRMNPQLYMAGHAGKDRLKFSEVSCYHVGTLAGVAKILCASGKWSCTYHANAFLVREQKSDKVRLQAVSRLYNPEIVGTYVICFCFVTGSLRNECCVEALCHARIKGTTAPIIQLTLQICNSITSDDADVFSKERSWAGAFESTLQDILLLLADRVQ